MAAHPTQMHNLTTLIKRLEAATSRLEDIASIPSYPASSTTTQQIQSTESAASTIRNVPLLQPPVVQEELPPCVEEFDELIAGPVAAYVEKSKALDEPLIIEQSKAVEKCFAAQRKFLLITTKARKPEGSTQFMDLLTSMQREWANASNICESNRGSPHINYLQTISEGITSLTWVATEMAPAKHVGETLGGAQFWGNRILTTKHPAGAEWVRSIYNWITALQAYTKKWYPAGLTWNAKGIDAREALLALDDVSSSNPVGFSGGAPPPPPPPLPNLAALDGSSSPKADPVSSVFAAINRGADVTAGLRKVSKEDMTHKNPSLRASSVVPAARPGSSGSLRGKSPAPPTRAKPAGLTMKKPPKKELDGNKWMIENYENESALVLEDVEINQSVFIFRCKNTVIQINGKINAVSINECTKTGVIVDNLVSSIDIIKSNSFSLQINGSAPTVQVDQCDGGTIYLSKTNPDIEVLTSKSTAINIDIPHAAEGSDEWDYVEKPVPEQLRHTVKGGLLKSEIVEHAG
ncbi:adenylyl cyclase-associated protein [Morchella conica CCBAS932]|uniref:Adenylyl cyclase-associated protein n=1 Tax=Morchella conica CCBAS932 TaxID=1392247 RepID=A0A3N4L420_9PEZI|nr:adenylyl cyclase-associated protein [Morchella conica CCBAS932]